MSKQLKKLYKMKSKEESTTALAFKALGIPLDIPDKDFTVQQMRDVDIWVRGYEAMEKYANQPVEESKDVDELAKDCLRNTFDKWTGRTCSDEQWDEYLQKESIQLTLAAMISFKAGYKAQPTPDWKQRLAEAFKTDSYEDFDTRERSIAEWMAENMPTKYLTESPDTKVAGEDW